MKTVRSWHWNDDEHNLMHGCRVKWNLQLLLQEMKSSWHCPSSMDILPYLWSMLGITYLLGASLVPCKSKLYHLLSRLCHFIVLKFEPHHLPSEWCRFTSCLWNLNDDSFLKNDDRLYIRSRCCIISPLWPCLCNVKILGGMFRHLQSLRNILWRLQRFGVVFPASSRFCWHFLASSKS